MKTYITTFIKRLCQDEDKNAVLQDILLTLQKSKNSSDMLASEKGESLLGQLLLCAIKEPEAEKKELYAQAIGEILYKSPPYSLLNHNGPFELLTRKMPDKKKKSLMVALLDAALEDKSNVILFTVITEYYFLNKEALVDKSGARAYLTLLTGRLKDAMLCFNADTVDSLLFLMSAGLTLEKMTVLSLVLDKIITPGKPTKQRGYVVSENSTIFDFLRNSSEEYSPSFSSYRRIQKLEDNFNDNVPLPVDTIGVYRKTNDQGEENHYICWNNNCNPRLGRIESKLVDTQSLQTTMTINGKPATVLEHLNALKSDESLESIQLLDFFLDIGQGCPFEREENLRRIFFAIQEKIYLFPEMFWKFFIQEEPYGHLILDGIFKCNRVKITGAISQSDNIPLEERERIQAKHSLFINFLTVTLCYLFSLPLEEKLLLKLDNRLKKAIISYIRGFCNSNTEPCTLDLNTAAVKVILLHWIKNALQSYKGVNNKQVKCLLDFLGNLIYLENTVWFEYALTEISNQNGCEIFKEHMSVSASNFFRLPKPHTLFSYAVSHKKELVTLLMNWADESALKSLLPLRAMEQFLESANQNKWVSFMDSSAGEMLISPNINLVFENLFNKEQLTTASTDFFYLYLQICCNYGLGYDHRVNKKDDFYKKTFDTMAKLCVNTFPPRHLSQLLLGHNIFFYCLAKTGGCDTGIYRDLLTAFKETKLEGLEFHCSCQTLSLNDITKFINFAAKAPWFDRINISDITIIESDRNSNFSQSFDFKCLQRNFTVDLLSHQGENGLSEEQLISLVEWLIRSKQLAVQGNTSLTIFLDEPNLTNVLTRFDHLIKNLDGLIIIKSGEGAPAKRATM